MDRPVAKRTVRDDNSFLANYPDHSYGPFGNKEEVSLMILFANDLDHPLWTVLDCKYCFANDPDLSGGPAFSKEDGPVRQNEPRCKPAFEESVAPQLNPLSLRGKLCAVQV